jgi:deoxyribonucleoside regulator
VAYDEHVAVKIATLYYLKEMSQEGIAARLGVSRQSVSRHLKFAKEKGIVEFTVRSPLFCCSELECQLESMFGLHEAIVVSATVDSEEIVKNEIGKAAAAFLDRRIQPGDILGVSWSSTVLACTRHLKKKPVGDIRVVQLNGSMDIATYSTRAEYIVEQLSLAFGGTSVTMAAPLLVDSARILKTLLNDSRIQSTFDLAKQSNIALFGIGCISQESSLYKAGYIDARLLERLLAASAAGDICGHFFDAAGEICDARIDERILAIPKECIQEKPLSVGVAGGRAKVGAIRAALKGKWCNVLITDEETARAVVEAEQRGAA